MPSSQTKFAVKQSGSAAHVNALYRRAGGVTTAIKQLFEQVGGAPVLVEDYTTPGALSGVSIALVQTPSSSHAVVSWTAVSSGVADWYDVKIVWYRNGTATQTDQVAQSAGLDASPTSNTWAVGDVVKAEVCYANRRSGALGSTTTTSTVTLTAGTGGPG